MKIIKTSILALAAGLLFTACNNGEAELWRQIQKNPSSALINQYLAEYPDGENAQAVKDFYAPYTNDLDSLQNSGDFQAYLDFHDKVQSDSLKAWALNNADTLLLATINKEASYKTCSIYVARFPKSKDFSKIEAELKKQQEAEKARQEAEKKSKEIDNALNKFEQNVNNIVSACANLSESGIPNGSSIMMRVLSPWVDAYDGLHAKVLKHKANFSSEQQARYNKIISKTKSQKVRDYVHL